MFEINLADSGVLVEKSNAPIGGAFYHSPQPGPFQLYVDNPPGVVTNDNSPNVADDKEFIVADNNASSPRANNVYATWTRFAVTTAGVGGDSPIYFSQSTDGGATWSKDIEITGANAAILIPTLATRTRGRIQLSDQTVRSTLPSATGILRCPG